MEIVLCHSGSTYAESPRALFWQGQRLGIQEILASWRIPEGRCFRVKAEDGNSFELTYHESDDRWSIQII